MHENNKFKIVSSKKTRYILPNMLTLVGVCVGISSIKFALDQNYSLAVIFVLVAALLDALDGRVARLIKGTSDFGKELDSLTDFVSFGIAPAFIIYFWALNEYGKIGWAITLIYSVCCVLRLARFNLTKHDENNSWKNNYFEGIPSPAGGVIILLPLILELSNFNINYDIKNFTPYLTILIAFSLISKIPTFSFKKISISSKFTIFILFSFCITFVSLIFFTFKTLFILCFLYLLTIPVSAIMFIKLVKKNNISNHDDEHEDVL